MITADPTKQAAIEGVKTLATLMKDQSPAGSHVATDANDTAVILYTSGTTGKPKGAELTHANVAMNVMVASGTFRQTADDIHLIVLPLFHSFGQNVQMNNAFMAGATDRAAGAIRSGCRVQGDAGAQGDDLLRRADDVYRAPQPSQRRREA